MTFADLFIFIFQGLLIGYLILVAAAVSAFLLTTAANVFFSSFRGWRR